MTVGRNNAARPQSPYDDWNTGASAQPQRPGNDYTYGSSPRDWEGGVSTDDFERLCRSIDETVSQVTSAIGKGIGAAGDAASNAVDRATSAYQQTYGDSRTLAQAREKEQELKVREQQRLAAVKARFRSTFGTSASGAAMTMIGAGGVAVAAIIGLCALFAGESAAILGVTAAAFAAAFAPPLVFGVRRLQTAQRAKSFQRVFGEREVCTIDELASQTNLSKDKVLASSRKMLKRGLLPQGHIDDEETCLMVTDNAYNQYRQTQRNYRQQQHEREKQARADARAAEAEAQARARAKEQRKAGEISPEARAFIETGRGYLNQMRDLDVAIDDELVSAKIVDISEVVAHILQRVEEESATLGALGRLNDYYLPTTVKLLVAYDSLEEQPVQGDNIAKSRREIESTLDVLLSAFDKLLDDTYRDAAIDVSSDISVLKTVLAQDGLTDNPFEGR